MVECLFFQRIIRNYWMNTIETIVFILQGTEQELHQKIFVIFLREMILRRVMHIRADFSRGQHRCIKRAYERAKEQKQEEARGSVSNDTREQVPDKDTPLR